MIGGPVIYCASYQKVETHNYVET